MSSARNRLSLETVNGELARRGHAERLAKGQGYFYFTGGEAEHWVETSVGVRSLNGLTLKQWMEEHRRLRELHAQISGSVRPPRG